MSIINIAIYLQDQRERHPTCNGPAYTNQTDRDNCLNALQHANTASQIKLLTWETFVMKNVEKVMIANNTIALHQILRNKNGITGNLSGFPLRAASALQWRTVALRREISVASSSSSGPKSRGSRCAR